MHDPHSAPTVVAGVDGSQAAVNAAVWAIDEAVDRDIPLKLVFVVHRADLLGVDAGADQAVEAGAALSEARRAVEAAAAPARKPVKIETEVLHGNPLATLIELSRSAAMVCVGSLGIEHACHRPGSTAAALAGSARCPVAVIRPPDSGHPDGTGRIVAEVDPSPDNNVVMRWAMAEARLRHAPLRVITPGRPRSGDAAGDDGSAEAWLNRHMQSWIRRYPDVSIESVVAPGETSRYLADTCESTQLLVSGTRDLRSLGRLGHTGGCSVLTVGGAYG